MHSEIVAKKSVMAFKVPFSRALRRLGLISELQGLVTKLRDEYGEAFMDGTRIVVAHPVRKNNFLISYRHNFLLNNGRSRNMAVG